MQSVTIDRSKKVYDAFVKNVESFRTLLESTDDDLTRQNLLRSIILFSGAGIDAVVKQLILESLDYVIERDSGAQAQFKKYVAKKIRDDDKNMLLVEILVANDSRKTMINVLKKELSVDSLQSPEQLYKVASYFNISTDSLIDADKQKMLKTAFMARNTIAHQLDVDIHNKELKTIEHDISDVTMIFELLRSIAEKFIKTVEEILKQEVTDDFRSPVSIVDGMLVIDTY